jgi:hypothetical protein
MEKAVAELQKWREMFIGDIHRVSRYQHNKQIDDSSMES